MSARGGKGRKESRASNRERERERGTFKTRYIAKAAEVCVYE